jgi:flagellar basal-body rod protein FlgC
MISAIQTALSGLLSQGSKVATAASNIANVSTTGSLDKNSNQRAPYTPVDAQFSSQENGGVSTTVVNRDPAFIPSYAPNSPFADENGIIGAPNISLDQEIVSLKQAETAYKANLKTIEIASEMEDALLNSFDRDR